MNDNGFLKSLYSIARKCTSSSARLFFTFLVFLGLVLYTVYTFYIIDKLEDYSEAATQAHAQLASEALFDKMGNFAKSIVIGELVEDFEMPIIFTDNYGDPMIWFNIEYGPWYNRQVLDFDDTSYAAKEVLRTKVKKFNKKYDPKLVYYNDSRTKIGWLYYDDSSFLSGLTLMPFFVILIVIVIVAGVILFLRAILVTERSNLWVGLAKETAHQLGTPITSLMGWIEYLDMESRAALEDEFGLVDETQLAERVHDIARDMSKDVARLRKVANRFGLVGSLPSLEKGSIEELLNEHMAYFTKRLPTLGKRIEMELKCDPVPPISMNHDLLSWVFENLFKNALDAIDKTTGKITVQVRYIAVDKKIIITHRDTGKGISSANKNSVFDPGFTTKKRGWGLGLTLVQRIVRDYHKGKIYISWTQRGKGTEFVIELPALLNNQTNAGAAHGNEKKKRPLD